jgi:hypothetical protein
MDVLLALLIAVVGGSAGTVLTQLFAASRDVDRDDRLIADRDESLAQWVADQHVELKRQMHTVVQKANAAEVLGGGAVPAGHAVVKAKTLHLFRDQRTEARRFVADLEIEERWAHRLWRRVRDKPMRQLQTPARAEAVIEVWREGLSAENDPTRRTLDSVLADPRLT